MRYIKYTFFVLALLAFSYIVAGQIILGSDASASEDICGQYNATWTMVNEDGSRTPVEIPGKVNNDYCIEIVVPEFDENVKYMCYRAQDMKVYLDGELIFEYTTEGHRWFGKSSPERYVFFPVSGQDAGKTLRIEGYSAAGIIYQPYVGSRLGIWKFILGEYAVDMVVAIITLALGVLTVVISKIYSIINKKKMDIEYLGCGIIFAALWLITNSVFSQIIFSNLSVASVMPFLMVMLMPFPFIIYMNEIQSKRYEKIYCVAGIAILLIDISCCALYILKIKELQQSFIFVAAGCFIAILSIFVTFIIDIIRRQIREYRYVAIGLLVAFLTSSVQLVEYFSRVDIFSGYNFAIGLLFILVGATIHTVSSVFSIEKDKQAAVMANESKGKFLAGMSHEIRTPINAILGMDEMILRESKQPQIREYAFDIRNAGKSLLAIINDILDISKIDSGKMEIINVEYDTSSLIHDVVNLIRHKAQVKNLTVNLDADENIPSRLIGDDIRIRQVLTNLLNNAVKYTEKGSVSLKVNVVGTENNKVKVHFEVKDTGIGIRQEDIPKLFQAYTRIEENRNRNIEGTGLGMNIAIRLLHLMGSELQVESTYGEGSVFYFEIEQEIIDSTPIGNLSERVRKQSEQYGYETSFVAPDAAILIVDDNAVNRKVVRNLLKDTHIKIDEADSGEKCLKKIVHTKYDVILLDHMMPGMDGIETLAAFKTTAGNKNSDTPVIALTANAVTGAKEMYLNAGFNAFLPKPVNYEKLEEYLIQFIPKEKIKMVEKNEMQGEDDFAEIMEVLNSIPEINLEYAFLHNSTPQNLYNIMVDFLGMIESDAATLEKYMMVTDDEMLKQYRVKVHAMKSSAAMIGAMNLSGMARTLELAAIKGKR
ncbi:MAG: response regulator, partial [Lachnospiraceae bacterium]